MLAVSKGVREKSTSSGRIRGAYVMVPLLVEQ
jgi:hypothetical protein